MSSRYSDGGGSAGVSSRSAAAAAAESFGVNEFGFENKAKFEGFIDYLHTKSRQLEPPTYPEPETTVWDTKPPDFRHQSYVPAPPKRTTIYSQQPWKYGTFPGHKEPNKERLSDIKPHPILVKKRPRSPQFQRRFRVERCYTSKIRFVKEGKIPYETPYTNPKDPQLRELQPVEELGLPEFDTREEKDPGLIKLNHKFIKHFHGMQAEPPTRDLAPGAPLKIVKSPPPLFEPDLVMKKEMWPKGMFYRHSAEYTRHRKIIRTAQSAFLERADRSLNKQWDRRNHGLPPIEDWRMPPPPEGLVKV